MAAQTPNPCSSRFFRILWPGFLNKLVLPKAFVKHMPKGRSIKKARVVNPSGDSWLINIYQKNQSMYFGGDGWLELIHAHNLELGHFLVFSYKGNMMFNFKAYDLSACEITYPSKVFKEKTLNPKGAKHFEVIMTRYNLSVPRLYIPAEFARKFDGFGHRRKLILEDWKGRSWPVHLCKRTVKYGSVIEIGKGWLQFAWGNKLEVGDRCIFMVVSESAEMVMQVEKI